jgi:hypothetical protein
VGRAIGERLLVARFKAGVLASHLKRRRHDKDGKVEKDLKGRLLLR